MHGLNGAVPQLSIGVVRSGDCAGEHGTISPF